MVKHIVIWNYKEGNTPEANQENGRRIKAELEALVGQIDGLVSLTVYLNPIPGCTGDIMLDSLFTSRDALAQYIVHPLHKQVGAEYVRPVTQNRASMDVDCE